MKKFNKRFASCISFFFLLLLILPNFGLFREKRNKELILEMETRIINPKPSAKFLSSKYFKQFEEWYNDRLLGRKEIVRGWAQLNGKLFHALISKEVEMGKDDFLFQPFNTKHDLIDKELKFAELKKISDLCAKHNSKFYVFLAPHSEWALQEKLPDKYKRFELRAVDNEMRSLLPSEIGYITINDKLEDLSLKEREDLYYKGDYHWNAKGAFIGAKVILSNLHYNKKIDQKVYYIKVKDSTADIYTKKIGWKPIQNKVEKPWNDSYLTDYKYQCGTDGIIKNTDAKESNAHSHKGETIIINPKATNKVTVLVMGDSFFGSMQEYLLQDVERIVELHNSYVSRPKKSIDVEYLLKTYQPDVVLYEKMGAFFYNNRYDEIFNNYK